MKLIYVVLTCVALVSTETPEVQDDLEISEFKVYNVLDAVRNYTPVISQLIVDNGLDPYSLTNIETEFWMFPGIPLISYKAYLNLDSGNLKDLSKLKFNEAFVIYESGMVTLAVKIEIPLLTIAYNYNLKLRLLNPIGTVKADVKQIGVNVVITYNITDHTVALDEFHLQTLHIGNVLIQDKSGWKHVLISFVAKILAELNRGKITNDVETEVTNTIQGYLKEVNHNVPPEIVAQFFQEKLLAYN